jgi:hypothetical protein
VRKLTPKQKVELKKKFTKTMNANYDNVTFTPRRVDESDPLLKEMLEAVRRTKTKRCL